MIERRRGERRRIRTMNTLDTWTSFGPVIRLLIAVAIIGGFAWGVLQIVQLVAYLKLTLTGS